MSKITRYPVEVREWAVRMVLEQQSEHHSQRATIQSVADKIGCTRETLCRRVRQAERDPGLRAGMSTDDRDLLKQLGRENCELKRANEILRKASAFFAQSEFGRRPKRWYRLSTSIGPSTGSSRSAPSC